MLAVLGQWSQKKLQYIPQEARDTYPLFLVFFLDTLAAVNIGYDKCPILETC